MDKLTNKTKRALYKKQNVRGLGYGDMYRDGKFRGKGIVVTVGKKVASTVLKKSDLIPKQLEGQDVDVIQVGTLKALPTKKEEVSSQAVDRTKKHRPFPMGVSIGHKDITAGTAGCLVYKNDKVYVLSNNHVLANCNACEIGDDILQPGKYDGGKIDDKVAELREYVPIKYVGGGGGGEYREMIRSTKYTLKYSTNHKKELITELFKLYGYYLQKTIDLMWDGKIPIKKFKTSKSINWMDDLGGQYKALIYKQASEIVRGCKARKGKKSKPVIKNFTINFDQKFIVAEASNNTFDKWIKLRLPFIKENKKAERIEILLPLKEHKHSLKFKDWKRAKTIRLSKNYISFIFETPLPIKKIIGNTLGIDQGYKKLLVASDGTFIGSDFEKYYEKIANKEQGSKAFKRALVERDNAVNERINRQLSLDTVKEVVIEDLKGIKQGTKGKIRKKFNNKLQRWVYSKAVSKLERFCEENRVFLTKVNPAYTSQRCSTCGFVHSKNRKGEVFKCTDCGKSMDADFNASVNLSQMGVSNRKES